MRYLTLRAVHKLHQRALRDAGGNPGIHNQSGLESALAQPQMTFAGEDIYPTIEEKAAALSFSLIKNHPFSDGNKRVGHSAMELFLRLNGYDLMGEVDEQERVILSIAAGEMQREEFTAWVRAHVALQVSE